MESKDSTTSYLLYHLRREMDNIENYITEMLTRNYTQFNSEEELINYFYSFMDKLYDSITYKDMEDIRYYTGYNYRDINAVYRKNWNYYTNGNIDRKKQYEEICERIDEIFQKIPNLPGDIIAYRGVDLEPFKSYGIESINDLVKMQGQYMYESGLTSTSLIKETSFYDRDLEYHPTCNILIEYLIPRECDDAIPLLTSNLSYSVGQNELVLTPSSFTKVVDVKLLDDGTKAILKVAYVPVRIWDHNRKPISEDMQR